MCRLLLEFLNIASKKRLLFEIQDILHELNLTSIVSNLSWWRLNLVYVRKASTKSVKYDRVFYLAFHRQFEHVGWPEAIRPVFYSWLEIATHLQRGKVLRCVQK
jgi:hypothetical protein